MTALIIQTLLLPFIFMLTLWMPMVISNALYTIFRCLGGQQLAYLLFGTTNTLKIDWTTGVAQLMMWVFISGFIIGFVALAISAFNYFKTGKFTIGRIKYIFVACASVFLVPMAYLVLTTLSGLIFMLLDPSGSARLIDYQIWANTMAMISDSFGIVQGLIGSIEYTNGMTFVEIIDKMIGDINQISADAYSNGYTELYSQCQQCLEALKSIKPLADPTWWANASVQMKALIENLGYGKRISPNDYEPLYLYINQLRNCYSGYAKMSSLLPQMFSNYSSYVSTGNWGAINIFINERASGVTNTDIIFLNTDSWLGNILIKNEYCLNNYDAIANTNGDLNIIVDMYQFVTGRSDTDWYNYFNYMSAITDLGSLIGGATAIGTVSAGMWMYATYVVRRIFELIALWVMSIAWAWMGLADDGRRFNTAVRLIVNKIFAIILIQLCFSLTLLIFDNDFMKNEVFGAFTSNDKLWTNITWGITVGLAVGVSYFVADELVGLTTGEANKLASAFSQIGQVKNQGKAAISGAYNTGKAPQSFAGQTGSSIVSGRENHQKSVINKSKIDVIKANKSSKKK